MKVKTLFATIVAFVTFAGIIITPATTMAQDISALAPPEAQTTETETIQSREIDLGLSRVVLKANPWAPYVTRNDVGIWYTATLSRNGLGLGPDTQDILRAVRDAEIRKNPEVAKYMEHSLLTEGGRIKDTYWLHEISTGGPKSSSKTVSGGIFGVRGTTESASAEKTFSTTITYLPTMESRTFTWTATYSSVNLVGLSYSRAFSGPFRRSGLPSFNVNAWDRSNPAVRAGLVCVKKVFEKVEDGGISKVKKWMREVSSKYLKGRLDGDNISK